MQKIAVFVDVQNIYYTTRQTYGRQFNYRKLWQHLLLQGNVVTAYAYAIDKGDDQQRKFQDALKHIGFDVKLKPFIQRSDGSAKGDWDVGIALDAIELAENVDTIVLVSGDGDFEILVERIKQRFGKKVEVYGVPGLTAQNLIDSASKFVPIEKDFLL